LRLRERPVDWSRESGEGLREWGSGRDIKVEVNMNESGVALPLPGTLLVSPAIDAIPVADCIDQATPPNSDVADLF